MQVRAVRAAADVVLRQILVNNNHDLSTYSGKTSLLTVVDIY